MVSKGLSYIKKTMIHGFVSDGYVIFKMCESLRYIAGT